ncbi:MAG: hypothetical protein A2020_05825 [Lentisphaerae bacterium GWF2_45_14]|nr:MAG: hypothetical protein A2020_05825 [Lentisphaerae bacterium GWF2_45_14]
MLGSIIIFLIVYLFIASEKIEKSVAAILGAVAVLATGLITFEQAVSSIDLNVIFLLIGMMTCVGILAETGFFEWVAISSAKASKGSAALILVMLLIITMVFSSFLDNVTTVILIVPVTILITQLLEIPTIPFLILEALASNIGGTATLIGDPPNIIIGSKANITFNDFIVNLAPCILVVGAVFIVISLFLLRKNLKVPAHIRSRVLQSYPSLALLDKRKMWASLFVFGLIFVGFFTHNITGLPPGVIALGGMGLMLLFCKSKSDSVLKSVEWDVILFFIGLFIVIGAMEHNGVINFLAKKIIELCGDNMLMACMLILWGSAVFSAILDNIPFVIAMTPLVQEMLKNLGLPTTGPHPLFWALALGACLGGNGTLIGASANVVTCKLGEKNGYKISFMKFLKWGFPLMVIQVLIAMVYMWFRYF